METFEPLKFKDSLHRKLCGFRFLTPIFMELVKSPVLMIGKLNNQLVFSVEHILYNNGSTTRKYN